MATQVPGRERGSSVSDPILFEVLRNELASVNEEMSVCVQRAGHSALLRTGDFATSMADAHGCVVGFYKTDAIIVGSFITVMEALMKKFSGTFRHGDVFISNDPYRGGSHKPDVFIIMPVFFADQLIGFTLAYSHHNDIGGRFPGGVSSHALNSYEEGLTLPVLKQIDRGVRNEALFDLMQANVRVSDGFLGDLEAKLSGCWRGAQELQRVATKYGAAALQSVFDRLIEYTERGARAAFGKVPPGTYRGSVLISDNGLGTTGSALPICVSLTFAGESLTVDFTGSADQVGSGLNMTISNTKSRVYDVVHALLCHQVPFNAGFAQAITITAPLGSITNPAFPAATCGRAPAYFMVGEAIAQALVQALPERVGVLPSGGDLVHITGRRKDGREFDLVDMVFGSWGGRPNQDGVTTAPHFSYSSVPVEMLERMAPLVVEELSVAPDSGGPGRYRGGLSTVKKYRFLAEASVMLRTTTDAGGGLGVAGGRKGSPPVTVLTSGEESVSYPQHSHLHLSLKPGDRLYHEVGGAAGYGDPSTRSPDLVRADIDAGRITPEGALRDYGYGGDTLAGTMPAS